jgi:YHS domain-containing protein
MKTPICPTCGCSLVRLGITREKAVMQKYQGMEYSFCCEGCARMFKENPEALLEETNSLIVCPSCLAEKPVSHTVAINYEGEKLHFCKCPHCISVFQENPDYYMKRLSGEIEFPGVFSEGGECCT